MTVLKRFDTFIKGINKKDRVAIMHDTDPDGVCSAVIMSKLLKKTRGRNADFRINQKAHEKSLTKETVNKLKKEKITKFISCDLSTDFSDEF